MFVLFMLPKLTSLDTLLLADETKLLAEATFLKKQARAGAGGGRTLFAGLRVRNGGIRACTEAGFQKRTGFQPTVRMDDAVRIQALDHL